MTSEKCVIMVVDNYHFALAWGAQGLQSRLRTRIMTQQISIHVRANSGVKA